MLSLELFVGILFITHDLVTGEIYSYYRHLFGCLEYIIQIYTERQPSCSLFS